MILPDLNLLIHAYNTGSPFHDRAKTWWESSMNDPRPVGLCWAVLLGFIRITTHRKILGQPLSVEVACGHVRSWLAQPQAIMLEPGSRHAAIVFDLLEKLGTAGNLTTDAHLAALAIEHNAELYSNDADFKRFPGLDESGGMKLRRFGAVILRRIDFEGIPRSIQSTKCNGHGTRYLTSEAASALPGERGGRCAEWHHYGVRRRPNVAVGTESADEANQLWRTRIYRQTSKTS